MDASSSRSCSARDYDGFGAVNASVRLAAQAMSERAGQSLDMLGELAL